jgi:hypothetical protein
VYDGLGRVTKSSTKTDVLDREPTKLSPGENGDLTPAKLTNTQGSMSLPQAQLLKVVSIVNWLGSYGLPVYQPSCTQIV